VEWQFIEDPTAGQFDDSPSLVVPETLEGAARFPNYPKQLFGAIEESPSMTSISPDSAYASRPMEPDTAWNREQLS